MRFLICLLSLAVPIVAFGAEAPPPAPATCPTGMVCVPAQFVQQAVLQLGLRDPIGGPLAQYLQQAETQRLTEASHEPHAAAK